MNTNECRPEDIALKSSFLGPQAENGDWIQEEMIKILTRWFEWRREFAPEDGAAISIENQNSDLFLRRQELYDKSLQTLISRFEKELPKFSPRYVGHMSSEISLPALLGQFVTLLHNPNNISREASRIGVEIEREAILALAKMIRYPNACVGHFTSGGTIANFEALLRAKQRSGLWLSTAIMMDEKKRHELGYFGLAHQGWEKFFELKKNINCDEYNYAISSPWVIAKKYEKLFQKNFSGPVLLVPENKHYSWTKSLSLLGLGKETFWPIQLDSQAHLDISDLQVKIERAAKEDRPILCVVSVAGTTELANIDPIHKVADLLEQYRKEKSWHIWHHVDGAYGGFFSSILQRKPNQENKTCLSSGSVLALEAMSKSDSITVDPHKLGYVPYSSGAVLIREIINDHLRDESAPYIDFDPVLDRGPYTIEGSRSAAGATATWMIDQCVGLNSEGYGRILERTLIIKNELVQRLSDAHLPIALFPQLDTNIVCFHVQAPSLTEGNNKTRLLYQRINESTQNPFIVSKTKLNISSYEKSIQNLLEGWAPKQDDDGLMLLRMTLMNPFLKSKEMKTDFIGELVKKIQDILSNL